MNFLFSSALCAEIAFLVAPTHLALTLNRSYLELPSTTIITRLANQGLK